VLCPINREAIEERFLKRGDGVEPFGKLEALSLSKRHPTDGRAAEAPRPPEGAGGSRPNSSEETSEPSP
jgi:hypothetical protein